MSCGWASRVLLRWPATVCEGSLVVQIFEKHGLADIGVDANAAVPALIETLMGNPEPKVRLGAAYALGAIRSSSSAAGTALRKAAVADRDPKVREEAVRSLRLILKGAAQRSPVAGGR